MNICYLLIGFCLGLGLFGPAWIVLLALIPWYVAFVISWFDDGKPYVSREPEPDE